MYILLRSAAQAFHCKQNYWLAALVVLGAAVLHIPVEYAPVIALIVGVWMVLCIVAHLPSEKAEKQAKELEELKRERLSCIQLADAAVERNKVLTARLSVQIGHSVRAMLNQDGLESAEWKFENKEAVAALIDDRKERIQLENAGLFKYADLAYVPSGELLLELIQPVTQSDKAAQNSRNSQPAHVVPDIFPQNNMDMSDEPDFSGLTDGAELEEVIDDPDASADSLPAEKEQNTAHDADLHVWMKKKAMQIRDLCFDAFSKKLDALTLKNDLPEENLWPRLAVLMEGSGKYSSVEVLPDGIRIHLKRENSLFA